MDAAFRIHTTLGSGLLESVDDTVLAYELDRRGLRTVRQPWSQFSYAEGGAGHVRIAFASHDVVVKGAGRDPLVQAIAAHRVASIREDARSGHFSGYGRAVH